MIEHDIVAQVEFVGEPFYRKPDPKLPFTNENRVRIVGAFNETTGCIVFRRASDVPITPSDLPHISIDLANSLHDFADVEGPSLSTTRRHGASTTGVSVDEIIRERGGDPDYRALKTGGFNFKSTRHEVAKERRKKNRKGQIYP